MYIPVGRILWVDTGDQKWGKVLYMVANPPIVCETCNSVVFDWRSSEDVICPVCESIVEERFYYPCPKCGEQDYMTLRVVNNNNWHYDSTTGLVNEYNDKLGFSINVCSKDLQKEIDKQLIRLYSVKDTVDTKRKILWTSQDEYDSTKPIPEWIKEQFKYEDQP